MKKETEEYQCNMISEIQYWIKSNLAHKEIYVDVKNN